MLHAFDSCEGFRIVASDLLETVCDNRDDDRGSARAKCRAESIFYKACREQCNDNRKKRVEDMRGEGLLQIEAQ